MTLIIVFFGAQGPLLWSGWFSSSRQVERAFPFARYWRQRRCIRNQCLARRPGANPDHQSFTAFALATKTTRCEATAWTAANGPVELHAAG